MEKPKKGMFCEDTFKKGVLKAHKAYKKVGGLGLAWCHVTHAWFDSDFVKAAHLVPRSLSTSIKILVSKLLTVV